MMDNSIDYARHLGIIEMALTRPSVLYQKRLKISLDGNEYCVLFGENQMEGIAGFGKTMHEALNDFDTNFFKPL